MDSGLEKRLNSVVRCGEGTLELGGEAAAGERDWDCIFTEQFRSHYGALVLALSRVVRERSEAEEVAAEAFYRLYKQGPQKERNHVGWVYRVGINLALDALRASGRRRRRETEAARSTLTGASADALQNLLAVEERDRVRTVLARLKPEHARVLVLGTVGISYREIAAMLGLKSDSIYTLVCRARARFEREYLAMYGRRL